jgi:hypothetical protein
MKSFTIIKIQKTIELALAQDKPSITIAPAYLGEDF